MNIQLSDHFNYKKLFLFTLPSVVMMVFTSVYCVVDGFFVSNFAGKTAFAAINLITVSYTHLDVYKRQAPALSSYFIEFTLSSIFLWKFITL